MTNYLSISQRIHEILGQLIAGTKPGERLPSEPALAKRLGVSRATLREAMRTFETQGMIRRRQGSGTYVTHPSTVLDTGLEVLESIFTVGERIGLQLSLGECRTEHRTATEEEALALEIDPGQQVVFVARTILAQKRPIAYLIDILPDDILTLDELNDDFRGSVLDVLLHRGTPRLMTSRTIIDAVTATPEIARLLGIQRGDVLLRFIAYLYATTRRVVDYSFSYWLPGFFRFHVMRRIGYSEMGDSG